MPSEIKPCPFCGSVHVTLLTNENTGSRVECDDCYAHGGTDDDAEDVAREWNRVSDAVHGKDKA